MRFPARLRADVIAGALPPLDGRRRRKFAILARLSIALFLGGDFERVVNLLD